MNSDQKMVATLGLVLVLLVIFGTYRKTLSAILFNQPATNNNIGGSLGGGIGGLLNPLNLIPGFSGLISTTVTDSNGNVLNAADDTTNGANTNGQPAGLPTTIIGANGVAFYNSSDTSPYPVSGLGLVTQGMEA